MRLYWRSIMRKKIKRMVVIFVETMVIVGITVFSVLPVSCKVSETGIHILGGDYNPPVLEEFFVQNENSICLKFSESVNLTSAVVSDVLNQNDLDTEIHYDEERKQIDVLFNEEMNIGSDYEMVGTVKDSVGNSMTFLIPFIGFNKNVAKILMTEIQSDSVSSQNSKEKENGFYRNEFIEFLVLSDGNLSGLEILSGYDGLGRGFKFPAIDVKKGEIIVVHLRKRGNGCISELGDDLNLSKNSYSNDNVRDLWTDSEDTALGNRTDVILLRNVANGEVLDCVMYRDSKISEWSKDMIDFSLLAEKYMIYESSDIDNATVSNELTATKTLYRVDAMDYLSKINNQIEFNYPVKVNSKSWGVGSSTPGSL